MNGIPRPLVRANQSFILVFSILGMWPGLHHLLLIPFIVGVHALSTKRNLLFRLVRPLLKKPLSEYVAEDPDQQRFNQWIAVICLGLSWLFFVLGINGFGYLFAAMVAVASGVALCGFCIGCFIRYRYLLWKNSRSSMK